MLPFPRMVQYGNISPNLPKISYDFSTGTSVNNGQLFGTLNGANYYLIPNSGGIFGIYGNPTLTLPSNISIGTHDYTLEAKYYLDSLTPGYANVCSFGNLGIRYGDGGFNNRLQSATSFATLTTCYTTSYTRNTTYHSIITFKIERKSNIVKLYLNDSQINFSTGTSTTYNYNQIVDNISITDYNILTLSSSNIVLIGFTLNF